MSKPSPASKQEDSRLNKLKQFLGIGSGKAGSLQVGNVRPQPREFIFTPEILKEISRGSPANNRMKTLRELCDIVQTKRLEDNAVEALWLSVQDLLIPQVAVEDRHLAFRFLCCLIKGQYTQMSIMRAHFFRVIKNHNVFEDLPQRLEMFRVLSTDGKDLEYFEEEAGPFLLEWMKDIMSSSKIAEFLQVLINVIKYNAAYLDEEIVSGLVLNTCLIATRSGLETDIELCLTVLDTVVCYSYLPSESLYQFIVCMCCLVSVEKFAQACWTLMRKLLGTHLGHSAIYHMCCILQDKNNITDSGAILLRGAVFFIGMALWGSKKVSSLKHPPSAVLPSFLQALVHSNSGIVAYEIVLSVQRLIHKYGKEQQLVTWDIILDIIEELLKYVEANPSCSPILVNHVHEVLTAVEDLHESGEFNGSTDRFFTIIERCAAKRPENSILVLVSHKAQSIRPSREGWINSLYHLMDKYLKHETRTKIRIKVLDLLAHVISTNRHLYEDELIEIVVLPQLVHIEHDHDLEVKKRATQLLVEVTYKCQSPRCLDVLDLIHKIINKPMSSSTPASPTTQESLEGSYPRLEHMMDDVTVGVEGLITAFRAKLYVLPSSHALRSYELLVGHVDSHYHHDHMIRCAGNIRRMVFSLLLELRADGLWRLGLQKEGQMVYSPYILCVYRPELTERMTLMDSASPPMMRSSPNVAHCRASILPYSQAFHCIRTCIEMELDWSVLSVVLERLPQVLRNKSLILASHPEDIDRFCGRLCAMVSNRGLLLPEKLINTPAKFTKSDFHSYIFPVLTCLVSYHAMLDKARQADLVRCLEFGLVSRCARICVCALTVCALEMQDKMMRQLPSVLLKLSQISATTAMAIPLMEFLSSLIRLPQLYANFVEEQYMSVFAIALPYTNPFKYSYYTVSLAYHVIAMWFLKCKLPFRKRFVGFIVKGLQANVVRQFEETASQKARLSGSLEVTDGRKAASVPKSPGAPPSVTDSPVQDRSARKSAAPVKPTGPIAQMADPAVKDKGMEMFHKELLETCIDMLARYTFSTCASMPKRSPVTDFLMTGGQTATWLLGNKIITVTTSGGSKVGKTGLCHKCLALAKTATEKSSQPQASSITSSRKRHKSAAVKSVSETMVPLKPLSQDDMVLHRQGSREEKSESDMLGKSSSVLGKSSGSLDSEEGAVEAKLSNGSSGSTSRATSIDREERMQMVDSVLLGLKARPTDTSIFSPRVCNCWCTQWSEIYIRRPTGNLSWMVRIQNEQDLTELFPEFPLADISNLFMTVPDSDEYLTRKKIDSMSLGETEYENLHEEYFQENEVYFTCIPEEQLSSDSSDSSKPRSRSSNLGKGTKLKKIEDDEDGNLPSGTSKSTTSEEESETASLRKSNSSPDLTLNQQLRLLEGKADLELQEAYTRSKNIVRDAQALHPVDSKMSTKLDETQGTSQHGLSSTIEPTQHEQKARHVEKSENNKNSEPLQSEKTQDLKEASDSEDDSQQLRVRSNTISGMVRPTVRRPVPPSHSVASPDSVKGSSPSMSSVKEISHGGVSPSFLFLQLFHSSYFGLGDERPMSLPQNEVVDRAVKMLDLVYPYETHKIGVVYVGPGQATDESSILSNVYGSSRYAEFLQGLGQLIRLTDIDPNSFYMGGLDLHGNDGQFAYTWHDDFMQVIFHVATLMPKKESDPNSTAKKLHIGNDYVTIVYNDSLEDYRIGTIKGQFNYVNIIVRPLDHGSNAVTVQTRDDIADIIGHTDTKIISDSFLALLVRQMAMHANLASLILQRQKNNPQDPYASNWLERLRQIKRIRAKVLPSAPDKSTILAQDFSDYV